MQEESFDMEIGKWELKPSSRCNSYFQQAFPVQQVKIHSLLELGVDPWCTYEDWSNVTNLFVSKPFLSCTFVLVLGMSGKENFALCSVIFMF